MWTILGLALSGSIAFGGSVVEPSCQLDDKSLNGEYSLRLECNKDVTPPTVSLEKIEFLSLGGQSQAGHLYTIIYL